MTQIRGQNHLQGSASIIHRLHVDLIHMRFFMSGHWTLSILHRKFSPEIQIRIITKSVIELNIEIPCKTFDQTQQ